MPLITKIILIVIAVLILICFPYVGLVALYFGASAVLDKKGYGKFHISSSRGV